MRLRTGKSTAQSCPLTSQILELRNCPESCSLVFETTHQMDWRQNKLRRRCSLHSATPNGMICLLLDSKAYTPPRQSLSGLTLRNNAANSLVASTKRLQLA